SEGTVRIAGYDILEESLEAKKRTGYLPECLPLYNDMTVRTYLDFVAELKGVSSRKRRSSVDAVIDRANLEEVVGEIIGKLSRGFRQRVAIAQSIVHQPEVIVLDEPTLGLDPKQIIQVRNLIRSLGGDHTVILSTHILPEVSMTCNRVVIINKGRLVAEGSPAELTNRLKGSEQVFVEVGGAPSDDVLDAILTTDGVTSAWLHTKLSDDRSSFVIESELNRDVRSDLAVTVVKSGFKLLALKGMGMSLEDIFLELTTEEKEVVES
ncbi:MAG: ATP-binding cassette domain-containing protein, partial [bacterium]|nr:ATP-binding cassette domain-containing protein [bacterium]